MNCHTISLVGLGKLGLCLASIYAKSGVKTIGIDVLSDVVNKVNKGIAPFFETDLSDYLTEVGGKRLQATLEHKCAIEESDITIILTATPSLPDGGFSNSQIEDALTSLSKELGKSQKSYHLFVISSTVMPGSIKNSFIPLIEKYSGREINKGFGICYDPDFVALGSVIKDFTNPDFILIGEDDPKDGQILEKLHSSICNNAPPVRHMSLASAEMAKVSLNAFITLKISFANLIGNICDKVYDANPDDITSAIGIDKRISPYYFKAGLSYGGTCFPRDTWAFNAVLKRLEIPLELMHSCHDVNSYQDKILAKKVLDVCKQQEVNLIGILGLSFKPDTPVIIESPAIKLIESLLDNGIDVIAYDPLAIDNTKEIFKDRIQYAESVQDCMQRTSISILTLSSKKMTSAICAYEGNQTQVLDCWRILHKEQLPVNVKLV